MATLRDWMPEGSYLVISAGTSTGTDPELIRCLQDAYGDTPVTGRTAAEIAAWFDGLSLVRPGLVDVWAWRPDTLGRRVSPGPGSWPGWATRPKPRSGRTVHRQPSLPKTARRPEMVRLRP